MPRNSVILIEQSGQVQYLTSHHAKTLLRDQLAVLAPQKLKQWLCRILQAKTTMLVLVEKPRIQRFYSSEYIHDMCNPYLIDYRYELLHQISLTKNHKPLKAYE